MPAIRTIASAPHAESLLIHIPEEYRSYSLEVILLPITDDAQDSAFSIDPDKGERLLKRKASTAKRKSMFGALKGKVMMSSDFDEPLEEFAEYM